MASTIAEDYNAGLLTIEQLRAKHHTTNIYTYVKANRAVRYKQPELISGIISDYQALMTFKDIKRKYRVSNTFIRYTLKKYNVPYRGRL